MYEPSIVPAEIVAVPSLTITVVCDVPSFFIDDAPVFVNVPIFLIVYPLVPVNVPVPVIVNFPLLVQDDEFNVTVFPFNLNVNVLEAVTVELTVSVMLFKALIVFPLVTFAIADAKLT